VSASASVWRFSLQQHVNSKHFTERIIMPAKYKFTYFNFYGRGEIVRLLFAIAGVEYDDIHIDGSEWEEYKKKTPFGQVPVLEFDGRTYCQSNAISRYLANKFGFAGKTELDKLQADMVVDCIVDIANPLGPIYHEHNPEKRAELTKIYGEKLKIHLSNLEKFLDANITGSGFFVGDSITWADLTWAAMVTWIYFMKYGPLVESFPKLAALRGKVEANPRVAEWVRKRPTYEI